MPKIAFIGLGTMGTIVAQAVTSAPIKDLDFLFANRTAAKAQALAQCLNGRAVTVSEAFQEAHILFLGVKPHQVEGLLAQEAATLQQREPLLIISMAAGLSLETLRQWVPAQHRLIRMMPNTPLAVGEGVVTYTGDGNLTSADKDLFEALFQAKGQVLNLDESLIDAATALAGCGPAFVYIMIEALADGAVALGLSRADAMKLAAQTLKGSAHMALTTGQHPAFLKDQVTSPGGSTIAGVASLEKTGLRNSLIQALEASYLKTQDLGK